MSAQQDSADQEIVGTSNTEPGTIEGIDETLTPLQYHYLRPAGGAGNHTLLLQTVWAMGPHKHESY